jgi:hypothetical protein
MKILIPTKPLKSHELAALLLAQPNLPVYRPLDGGEGGLQSICNVTKIIACDEDEKPTIECILLDTAVAAMPNEKS